MSPTAHTGIIISCLIACLVSLFTLTTRGVTAAWLNPIAREKRITETGSM